MKYREKINVLSNHFYVCLSHIVTNKYQVDLSMFSTTCCLQLSCITAYLTCEYNN